jgi:predicted dehydrogenase
MKKVIWGVLSTAKIGRERVLPGMLKSDLLEIRAIASRDEARARAAASALGIPRAHGSYEALLADPEIEAIYNPLPNHLHVPLTLQAAAAGKHVLCEKPIALTAQEALELRAAAGKVLIAEAFMVQQGRHRRRRSLRHRLLRGRGRALLPRCRARARHRAH